MSATQIDAMIWSIKAELMKRHGCTQAERDIWPLCWYINTGRASAQFLKLCGEAKPLLIARDLHKGGSVDETVARICRRIGYTRGTL